MMLKWWHKVFEDGFAHECMKDWISNSLKTSHILLNQFSYEVWGYGDANMSSVVLPRKRHININGSTCLSFSGHYDLNVVGDILKLLIKLPKLRVLTLSWVKNSRCDQKAKVSWKQRKNI
jgi:hypothetical protein